MSNSGLVSYGVQPQNPFVSAPGYGRFDEEKPHGIYGAAHYPSVSTAAHSGAYPASYASSYLPAAPAYPSHAAAAVPGVHYPSARVTSAPAQPAHHGYAPARYAGAGLVQAAMDGDHGSMTQHVQQGNPLYPEMELRLRPDGSRGANATWPEQLLRPRQVGEKVTTEPKYVEPEKNHNVKMLHPPPENAEDMIKKFKEPASSGILEKILAPHHALENIFGEHGPHGVLTHGIHKGLLPASRLYDYGPRRVAYSAQVPVMESNPGVIINKEFEIHEHHRFIDSPHKFQLMCHDDDCIRNVYWNHMGQLLHRPEDDEDSESELRDELKNHADYRTASDLRGYRREYYLEMQRERQQKANKRNPQAAAGGAADLPMPPMDAGTGKKKKKPSKPFEMLKGGLAGHESSRLSYYVGLQRQRAQRVTAGIAGVHEDHVEVAEDLTGFFKNSEEVLKEFVGSFEDD